MCGSKRKGIMDRPFTEQEIEYLERENNVKIIGRAHDRSGKHTLICPKGKEHVVSHQKLKTLAKCKKPYKCYCQRTFTKGHVSDFLDGKGITLISEYKNQRTKLDLHCQNCNHKWQRIWRTLRAHPNCPRCCRSTVSKNENFLYEQIKNKYPHLTVEGNNRDILKPREIDIVVKHGDRVLLGIEWNGEYWHTSKQVRVVDNWKREEMNRMGLDFIQIEDPQGKGFRPDFVMEQLETLIIPVLDKSCKRL
jgi:hypothetical protein